ncbi:MAG: aminoacyl-tRNA hydrolase [Deltaproteobacteria bacterium]|nr:aminoacyl-tRNA hydrolase [Deltaproteobacteria bacterium]
MSDAPLFVAPGVEIPATELEFSFSRSSGPGGQNVQKNDTRVHLSFDLDRSQALADDVRVRLRTLAGRRVTRDGRLVLTCDRHREQGRNLAEVRERLAALVRAALDPPRVRHRTRPTRASRERRLEEKRQRAALKRTRGQNGVED